ncbi:MAG: hypothetical protein RIR53_614, partial [Bacteroidota bacterium]
VTGTDVLFRAEVLRGDHIAWLRTLTDDADQFSTVSEERF